MQGSMCLKITYERRGSHRATCFVSAWDEQEKMLGLVRSGAGGFHLLSGPNLVNLEKGGTHRVSQTKRSGGVKQASCGKA